MPETDIDVPALHLQLQNMRGLSGRNKYQSLVAAENCQQLVQLMPPQELFLLIKELGVLDATDLIGFASPEQVTLCVDMDCWQGDTLDSDESFQWLTLLLIQDEEAFLRLIDGFDFELLVMMVKKQLTILSGLESLHDDEDLMAERKRFDQVYDCDYRNEDVAKTMSAFQDVMFRERQELFLQVMESVRHEFDLSLQEDVFVARNGRLGDLGFVEAFEARALYNYIDPATFNPQHHLRAGIIALTANDDGNALAPPAFMLTLAQPQDLLGELFSAGLSQELAYDLSFLLNRALSADNVDFGEPADISQVLQNVYYTLNISLGYLAGADLDKAETLLDKVYMRSLYQLGFSLTVQLRRRAEKISESPIGPYLDGPDAALINALCQSKPQFYNGLVDVTRADTRAFHSWAEVVQVQQELDCVEALILLFSAAGVFALPTPDELDLTGCMPCQSSEVTLSDLFLTALANRLLARDFYPIPINVSELLVLHHLLSVPADFAALRQQTYAWIEEQCAGCGAFANFCLDVWQHEFCALAPRDITPEYIGGLLIRL